jgi:hypothetical protein
MVIILYLSQNSRAAQPKLTGFDKYVNCTSSIKDSNGVNMYFGIYYNVDNTSLSVGVVCETKSLTDWCAWGNYSNIVTFLKRHTGFSTTGDMLVGDVMVGWVNSSGIASAEQFSLKGKNPPTPSKLQIVCNEFNEKAGCPSSSKVCPSKSSTGCCNNAQVIRFLFCHVPLNNVAAGIATLPAEKII